MGKRSAHAGSRLCRRSSCGQRGRRDNVARSPKRAPPKCGRLQNRNARTCANTGRQIWPGAQSRAPSQQAAPAAPILSSKCELCEAHVCPVVCDAEPGATPMKSKLRTDPGTRVRGGLDNKPQVGQTQVHRFKERWSCRCYCACMFFVLGGVLPSPPPDLGRICSNRRIVSGAARCRGGAPPGNAEKERAPTKREVRQNGIARLKPPPNFDAKPKARRRPSCYCASLLTSSTVQSSFRAN